MEHDGLFEAETILHFDESTLPAEIFTCNKTWAKRLIHMGAKLLHHDVDSRRRESWTFEVPKKWVRLPKPNAPPRGNAGRVSAAFLAKSFQKVPKVQPT